MTFAIPGEDEQSVRNFGEFGDAFAANFVSLHAASTLKRDQKKKFAFYCGRGSLSGDLSRGISLSVDLPWISLGGSLSKRGSEGTTMGSL